ncbi:MAG: DUF11 domain-containing protein, partial [Polyangiaceae bacterium]|nr:DUF11 domain-containing protein [Polyangiaceae bacterium]
VSAAGWSIIVAYRYDGEPIRNLSVFVGDTAFVDENTTVDYSVSGFCAPPAGEIEGTIAIATVEGDSNRVGDQLAIGQTPASNFVNLSGPNNPANNFFCSQINKPDGTLDTTGTFGNSNHTPGSNTVGGRQGWDLTHVQLSSAQGQLVAGQTSAVLRTQTLDDSYMPVMAGIAIDVNAPTFVYQASTTEVSTSQVELGDQLVVTATLLNEGSAQADGVSMTLAVPSGISLVDFQTNGQPGDINGGAVDLATMVSGVTMGDVAPGDDRVVTATLQIDAPQSPSIFFQPVWSYAYVQCAGNPTSESFAGEVGIVSFVDPGTGGGGQGGGGTGETTGTGTGTGTTGSGTGTSSSMSTASSGDDGDGDGGAGGGDGADKQLEADGCDCSVPSKGGSSLAPLALLALLALRRKKAR